jgi:hypothetical protein
MSDTTITDLELVTYAEPNDFLALDRGNATYKIRASNLASANANNIIYVSTQGSDFENAGTSIAGPFLTIKRACAYAASKPDVNYTILIATGEYLELNPIVVPQNTSLIGQSPKRVIIKPLNKNFDILWINDGCYIKGLTFKDHLSPAAAISFPIYSPSGTNQQNAYSKAYNTIDYEVPIPDRIPTITNTPVVMECESITKSFIVPLQYDTFQTIDTNYYGNSASISWCSTLFQLTTSVLQFSVSAYPRVFPNYEIYPPAYQDFVNFLIDKKERYTINKEDYFSIIPLISGFNINLESPSLSGNFFRDMDIILTSLIYDVSSYSGRLFTDVGRNYFYGNNSLILPFSGGSTKYMVASALDLIYYTIKDVVFSSINPPYQANTIPKFTTDQFTILKDIVVNQSTYYNITTSVPLEFQKTAYLLNRNKQFLVEESFNYTNAYYYGIFTNSEINENKTRVGLLIDSIVHDLSTRSNSRTLTNAYIHKLKLNEKFYPKLKQNTDIINHVLTLTNQIIINQPVSSLNLNCGTGLKIDGLQVDGYLRDIFIDTYSQLNEGGIGIHVTNNARAYIENTNTICCEKSILCENGGLCTINDSSSTYGISALVATGKSPTAILDGSVEGTYQTNTNKITVNSVDGIVLYNNSQIGDGTIAVKPSPNMIARFLINNNPLSAIDIPIVENPIYLGNKTYELTFTDNLPITIPSNTPVYFYNRSTILASSHIFEYVGAGVYLQLAIPALNGDFVSTNETCYDTTEDKIGGIVYCSSTDQNGMIKLGEELTINQNTGMIEGDTFNKSVYSLVTPLIIALE